MEATLKEYRVQYVHAVFTSKRLLDMADEAKADGLQEAHDCLVAAAEHYTKRFEAVRIECMKAFPEEAVRTLAFDVATTHLSASEEPKA